MGEGWEAEAFSQGTMILVTDGTGKTTMSYTVNENTGSGRSAMIKMTGLACTIDQRRTSTNKGKRK